ncbi:MAG: SUMF1/EgtB/PvdO family nonheme iron enzyme [Puniceicoccales bacterium]|nr:SUMF1/EgtB/PvdO family nonheme iron enzyme [Puniceicoccales bacterium]
MALTPPAEGATYVTENYQGIELEFALIGDVGNLDDTILSGGDYRGAVDYEYYISKYAVTQGQWAAFLNAVATDKSASADILALYNGNMNSQGYGHIRRTNDLFDPANKWMYVFQSDYEDRPVVHVSLTDAQRFCNWLTTGNTESGVYDMTSSATVLRDPVASLQPGAVVLPTENEWYKAAYYDPNKGAGGYYTYSFGHANGDCAHMDFANYDQVYHDMMAPDWGNGVYFLNEVGFYENYSGSLSSYGVADMTGNVWEWTDSQYNWYDRVVRGSAFHSDGLDLSAEFSRAHYAPSTEDNFIGFRVASVAPIPEPSTYGMIGGALVGLLCLVRRKRRAPAL